MKDKDFEPCWVLGTPRNDTSIVDATLVDPKKSTLGPIFLVDENAILGSRAGNGKLIKRVLGEETK